MNEKIIAYIKSKTNYKFELKNVGKYQDSDAYLIVYEDKTLILGPPLLTYEKEGEIIFKDCISDKEANKLYLEYIRSSEGD